MKIAKKNFSCRWFLFSRKTNLTPFKDASPSCKENLSRGTGPAQAFAESEEVFPTHVGVIRGLFSERPEVAGFHPLLLAVLPGVLSVRSTPSCKKISFHGKILSLSG
jgi:hypothetical protein